MSVLRRYGILIIQLIFWIGVGIANTVNPQAFTPALNETMYWVGIVWQISTLVLLRFVPRIGWISAAAFGAWSIFNAVVAIQKDYLPFGIALIVITALVTVVMIIDLRAQAKTPADKRNQSSESAEHRE